MTLKNNCFSQQKKTKYPTSFVNSSRVNEVKSDPSSAQIGVALLEKIDKITARISITQNNLHVNKTESFKSTTYTAKPTKADDSEKIMTFAHVKQEPLQFEKSVIITEEMSMLEIHEKIMSRRGKIDEEAALKKLYPLEDFESHKNK